MASMQVLCLLVALLQLEGLNAKPDGAPEAACATMVPGHGPEAQATDSPFTLTPNTSSVDIGEAVRVTVSSDTEFGYKGILLQVRKVGESTALGSFTGYNEGSYHTLDCFETMGSALTHSSNNAKPLPMGFTWTAPDDLDGAVEFVASVVTNTTTFWVGVKSSSIDFAGATPTPTAEGDGATTVSASDIPHIHKLLALFMACIWSLL